MGISSGCRRFIFCVPLILFLPIFFSVLELHQTSDVQETSKNPSKKLDHLLLGPAAGQGLRDRLQCRGLRALNRTYFSTWSQVFNFSDSISFVTVFAVYNSSPLTRLDDKSSNMVTVGSASYSKAERSMAILNVFINFIQVSMPKSNIIILADPASDLALRRYNVSLFTHPR